MIPRLQTTPGCSQGQACNAFLRASGVKARSRPPTLAASARPAGRMSPSPSSPPSGGAVALPRLVAFDLDGTLWWPEMYMLDGGAPFRRDSSGRVFDRRGEQVELMGASEQVLRELATDPKWADTQVAYVSRTEYPEWAIPCLKTFLVAGNTSMFDMSHHQEIYPGSKVKHFKVIHEASGVEYQDMLFFDNERWNCTECSKLGIHCVYTPKGLTREAWDQGLEQYTRAKEGAGAAAGGRAKKK